MNTIINAQSDIDHPSKESISDRKVSVIIPAYNEEDCIASVLNDIFAVNSSSENNIFNEVIVVDNHSTDNTADIAKMCGAIVVQEPIRGYGQACWTGIKASKGDILLFVDGDGSANIDDANNLINAIQQGADLAIGVRTDPEPGSMSFSQKFGNSFACYLIRCLWQVSVTDLGPFRAVTKDLLNDIHMQDRSFGWTVEMQVKASRVNADVRNIPVKWHNRIGGQSKISGTVTGVFFAGTGILKMIAKLWRLDQKQYKKNSRSKLENMGLLYFSPSTSPTHFQDRCVFDHSKEINQ